MASNLQSGRLTSRSGHGSANPRRAGRPRGVSRRVESVSSRAARTAAEMALVRIVHHYGSRPEFVVLGGLVPELLCARSRFQHAGTTDVDVQVNLEIACGAVNTARLERALRNAEFVPEHDQVWRWVADDAVISAVVRFELFADLHDRPTEATIEFDECQSLGAVNLRGTGYASYHVDVREFSARIGGVSHTVAVNVAGLAGFLLAKTAAAYSRRKPKDWYDIAFVLLHNDAGGVTEAATLVRKHFAGDLGTLRTALLDLKANFANHEAQGSQAYVQQMIVDHPDLDEQTLGADAVIAVEQFLQRLKLTERTA